jgi:hypothetical protein
LATRRHRSFWIFDRRAHARISLGIVSMNGGMCADFIDA